MFIFIQKMKFIPHLFLEILSRYCKLAILGTLAMPHYSHQKQQYQHEWSFWCFSKCKKSTCSLTFFNFGVKQNFPTRFFLIPKKNHCAKFQKKKKYSRADSKQHSFQKDRRTNRQAWIYSSLLAKDGVQLGLLVTKVPICYEFTSFRK